MLREGEGFKIKTGGWLAGVILGGGDGREGEGGGGREGGLELGGLDSEGERKGDWIGRVMGKEAFQSIFRMRSFIYHDIADSRN